MNINFDVDIKDAYPLSLQFQEIMDEVKYLGVTADDISCLLDGLEQYGSEGLHDGEQQYILDTVHDIHIVYKEATLTIHLPELKQIDNMINNFLTRVYKELKSNV